MYTLILLFIFGLGLGFFSTENLSRISLHVANYTFSGVPLYMIILGSVFLGIVLSWLVGLVDMIASMLAIHQKNQALKHAYSTIETLKDEKYHLELENARLQGVQTQPVIEERHIETITEHRPSFFERLRQSVQPNYKLSS